MESCMLPKKQRTLEIQKRVTRNAIRLTPIVSVGEQSTVDGFSALQIGSVPRRHH